jgi:hypothetical protein
LLRVGFTEPPQSPGVLVVSYTTVSPLPALRRVGAVGGLFSVALSRELPRVGVAHHPARWSPDLPRYVVGTTQRGRPAGLSAYQPSPKRERGAQRRAKGGATKAQPPGACTRPVSRSPTRSAPRGWRRRPRRARGWCVRTHLRGPASSMVCESSGSFSRTHSGSTGWCSGILESAPYSVSPGAPHGRCDRRLDERSDVGDGVVHDVAVTVALDVHAWSRSMASGGSSRTGLR